MALYADRVKDSTSITGTGAITLSGTAPTGFQSFATAFGASPVTVAYCIADQTGNNWEVGTGVFDGTTGLTRVTVLGSSNGGSLVNFSGGTQDVFCTAPAAYLLPAGSTTQIQFNNAGAFGASANFTYVSGTNTVSFGNITGSALGMTIQPLAPTSVENAGQLTLRARNAVKANSSGGEILLATGTPTGTGDRGRVVVQAGTFSYQGASASTFDGGSFTATCGNGFRTGGGYQVVCGNGTGTVGTGGGAYFETGSATQAGGTAGDAYFYVGRNEITDQGGAFRFGSSTFGDAIYITHDAIDLQMGFFNAAPVYKPAPTASGTGNVLSSVVTALNSLGLVSSASLTNASTLTAAGSNTQIQFNNSNAFGASANFTYNTGTNTFTVGPAGAETIIETLAPTGSTITGSLRIRGKNASATNGNGGVIRYTGGDALGTGTGGGHFFTCGSGRTGGGISFVSANGTLDGGSMLFNAGAGNAGGTGGNFTMNAGLGSSTASGGSFELAAGNAASSGIGGGFTMFAGSSPSGGLGGDVYIVCGFGTPSGSIYLGADSGTVIQITEDATPNLQLGFYGAVPVNQQASAPVATNLATAITLVNALRTALLNLGLIV